jgi:hypothetical protein
MLHIQCIRLHYPRSRNLNAGTSANLTTIQPTYPPRPPHPSSATHHKTSSPQSTSHHHGSTPDPSSQPQSSVSALAKHPIRYSSSTTKSTSYKANSQLRHLRRSRMTSCIHYTPTWTGTIAGLRRRRLGRRWIGRRG